MADNQRTDYLKLKLNEQILLLPLQNIRMVLPLPALQSLPDQDDSFEGMLNFHGTSVPVYSLFRLTEHEQPSYNLDTPLLLCEVNNSLLGLLVSEVSTLLTVPNIDVQKPKLKKFLPYVTGIYEQEQWAAWILNLEKLVEQHQLTSHTGAANE